MSIKSNGPNLKSQYKQGRFRPQHPEKYAGNPTQIIYRSGWELLFCQYCDRDPRIVRWGSEEVPIRYVHPIKGVEQNYYVDFWLVVREADGKYQQFLVEIKPKSQLTKPQEPRTRRAASLQRYAREIETFQVNAAKFVAARHFATQRGMKFTILTEDHLHRYGHA